MYGKTSGCLVCNLEWSQSIEFADKYYLVESIV